VAKRKKSSIPFVGLHAHSNSSVFDGLGYPQEHMDYAFENGSDALALTDHGNMNNFAYQIMHAKKMQSEGKDFKPIYGIEAYFLPSISKWKREVTELREKKPGRSQDSGICVEEENHRKKKKGILNRRSHIIVLAKNQTGLSNLFNMVSDSYDGDNFYRYPRIDYKMLSKYSDGLIASSACLGGVYASDYWKNRDAGTSAVLSAMEKTTEQMQSVFGESWYAELQWNKIPEQHELNLYIIKTAQKFGVDLISTADSHYPGPDFWKDRELYRRLGWISKKARPDWLENDLPASVDALDYELYPKNGEQMWEAYKSYSEHVGAHYDDDLVRESIERTHDIAHNHIESFFPNATVQLPEFVVPEGKTADQALAQLCVDGLKGISLAEDQDYIARLKHEIETIQERGFSRYFLTMKAIADKATESQLVGPGRGSAAGSLISYVLGITQVDPIKYNLQFSRFLTKDGEGYPDIDYDVSEPMELKERLIEEWGSTTVVPISNWNTLQLRSLIKDVSKFYDIPFTEVNMVTGRMMLEATPEAKKANGIKAGMYSPTFEEVMMYSISLQNFLKKYPQVKTHIDVLYGQVRSCSRHAGGIVVGENLDKRMPLINSKGVRQTPWTEGQHVRHLEPMGFIKFDILGLASLRMMEESIKHVLKRHHGIAEPSFDDVKRFYDKNLHPDVLDFNNQEIYENIYQNGKWAGIFQFTESGAQRLCQKIKPTNLVDLAAVTSIFRPGPLNAGVDKDYVAARSGEKWVDYPHETYKEVTQSTSGFLIFQEQIASLAHKLGKDISLDEGNKLRKLLTKKGTSDVEEKKKKIHKKFIEGCGEKEIDAMTAQRIWEKFEYFSGYGFNKSHAMSYSMLSFQCAWLFNYYPAEWMAAFLDKEPEGRKERAITTAKRFGFEIEPANINKSGKVWEISADGKNLIQPLTSIKGLGDAAISQVIDNRPFDNVEDFIFSENIVYSKLNKKALDVLIRCGALDELIDERFSGAKHFWTAVAIDRPKNKKRFLENIEMYREEGSFSTKEKINYFVDLTGIFPIELVMEDSILQKLEDYNIPPLGEWDNDLRVAWFIPREVIKKKTKNGKTYWIVKVIESTSNITGIKCWGIRDNDRVLINHPYMARLDYSEQWGFSTRSIKHNFKLLG